VASAPALTSFWAKWLCFFVFAYAHIDSTCWPLANPNWGQCQEKYTHGYCLRPFDLLIILPHSPLDTTNFLMSSTTTIASPETSHQVAQGQDTHSHQSLDSLASNPLRRTWRGDKEGSVELKVIPQFQDKYAEREWVKVSVFCGLCAATNTKQGASCSSV
jgi:hypothetical protein